MARVPIGTSGWHYDSWRSPFFSTDLPFKRQLKYYAGQFQTTELNGVFYRIPGMDAVKALRVQTSDDFAFTRFITHWKRLSDNSTNSLALIEERLAILGEKAGRSCFNCRRISRPTRIDCCRFSSCYRNAAVTASSFGIRADISRPAGLKIPSRKNAAHCLSDHHDAPAPWKRTADFVYVRGHGPAGQYKDHYQDPTLVLESPDH
ncbi:DUF72 domain-containing protein [Bradyrhizobium sp.]|uniref:DUF72 domain-containing protein n=1 Tax=Bradyrhizobium sp. TaxID=376 RepID=UPI002606EBFA|nr:DUF72 domain-containing protein [Bradyrhizobium sp.]